MSTMFLAQLVVLVIGALLFSVLHENIASSADDASFSLPFSNVLLVVVVGGAASFWWGWSATVVVLAVYAAFSIATGWLDR